MRRSRVVLPQPDGPRSVKNSFSPMVTSTLSSALTASSPLPKILVTPSASIALRRSTEPALFNHNSPGGVLIVCSTNDPMRNNRYCQQGCGESKNFARSAGPATIDDKGLTGDESRFVAGEIDHQCGDFLRAGQTAHGLAGDEGLAGLFIVALLVHAIIEGRCIDGAGANGVAADALVDEVDRQRLGEADDRGLGGAIDEAVGRALYRGGNRGHVDDRTLAPGQHGGQEGLDHPVMRLGIEIEGEIPGFLVAIEDGSVMDEARAVEQDIDICCAFCRSLDGLGPQHVKSEGF